MGRSFSTQRHDTNSSQILAQITDVSIALRAGNEAKPVAVAEAAVRSFATKELGKAQGAIAALED
jgi:hypothetical protein